MSISKGWRSKQIVLLLVVVLKCLVVSSQSYNAERVALANYLVRMYKSAPFEGVRVVEDYEQSYLLSVVAFDSQKYNDNESTMNRVASVKAMSQASRFFNGSTITDDVIIRIVESSSSNINTETIETIKEKSVGYVQALEQLTNFTNEKGYMVFLFIAPINNK